MRVGSLFSGAGGLDIAAESYFSAATVWHCEVDPAAAKVLNHRWPGVPNLGDITKVDWSRVEPIDVLCGGFPCQDVSQAGRRLGLAGARSGLWANMRQAIAALRPEAVVIENVRGLAISGGIDQVLEDLTRIDYAATWTVTSAASVGAPHRRRRVFILAHPATRATSRRVKGDDGAPKGIRLLPTPEAKNAHAGQDYARSERPNSGGDDLVTAIVKGYPRWSEYAVAIGRWEHATRPAPYPTEPTNTGNPRLNPEFSEWLMGWPAGWVTDVPSDQCALFGEADTAVDRSNVLKLCGNGVVPQQAAAAIQLLHSEVEAWA